MLFYATYVLTQTPVSAYRKKFQTLNLRRSHIPKGKGERETVTKSDTSIHDYIRLELNTRDLVVETSLTKAKQS